MTESDESESDKKSSNFQKLKLLLWKNMRLQISNKVQSACVIFIPIIFSLMLVPLRAVLPRDPILIPEKKYGSFDITLTSIPIGEIFYSPKNKILDAIIQKVVTSLNAKGSKAFKNLYELELELRKQDGFVGIEFEDSLINTDKLPSTMRIALRFPQYLRSKEGASWDTNDFFASDLKLFYQVQNPNNSYVAEGFLAVQASLSEALLTHKLSKPIPIESHISMQRYPEHKYLNFDLISTVISLAKTILIIAYIHPAATITKAILQEKESQLKEIMRIMGISNWLHWLAWFIKSFVLLGISAFVIGLLWSTLAKVSVFYYSNTFLILLVLAVYITNITCFAFMISAFFSRALWGSIVCVLAYLATVVPILVVKDVTELSVNYKIPICFCLNSAIYLVLSLIQKFEIRAIGLRWNNLFRGVLPGDPMSIGVILLLMLLSSILSVLICLYFEQVRPGEYGVARPWYFPFTSSFWCLHREQSHEDEEQAVGDKNKRNPASFEDEPQGKNAVVQAQELRKVFNGREAVKNFSLNFFEDEITVLLGHNGAGKTTTFMMLTGMYQPTSGRAIVNGYDIASSPNMARKSLSLCPQHNVLFEDLSVRHHIQFYSRLKGLSKAEIKDEINNYLQRLNLVDKAKTPAKSLSGGMKRKLSLCCALCGRTKVVFCDEPSAGLDPSARRDLWNLLQSEKAGRCIVLTTHYMDEAEVLADRIAIMSDGELHGYGTTSFLQQSVGSGYRLVCVTLEGCNVNKVTNFLRKFIKNIKPESKVGADLSYRLPTSEAHKFGMIFQKLEKNQKGLKLNGFGINACTLAEVFMQVGAENNKNKNKNSTDKDGEKAAAEAHEQLLASDYAKEKRCLCIYMNHWQAMFKKKCIFTCRHKLLFGLVILLPLIIYLLYLLIELITPPVRDDTLLEMNFSPYSGGLALMDLQSNNKSRKSIAKQYEVTVKAFGGNFRSTEGKPFSDYLLQKSSADQREIDRTYIAAVTISDDGITAWLNWYLPHSAPLTLNLVYNALGKAFIDPDIQIIISNKPRPESNTEVKSNNMAITSAILPSGIIAYLCLATAVFILMPVSERVLKVKAQQFISGISPFTYWLSHFLWDMGLFILMTLVVLIVLHEKSKQTLSNMAILLLIFAWAGLPYTYLVSRWFADPPAALIYIFILNILYAFVVTAVIEGSKKQKTTYDYVIMLHPHYSVSYGVMKLFSYSDEKDTCKDLDEEKICELIGKCCPQPPIWEWLEVYFLLCTGLLYLIILLLSSYLRRLGYLIKKCQPERGIWRNNPKNTDEDDDVRKTRERVKQMSKDEIKEHTMVLDNVIKRYCKFIAVRGISLDMKAGECFGLLGLNGAGKSSTFNMIVGEQMISSGRIYIKGYSMKTKMRKCFSHIGYCPQVDALFNIMTGRENLQIFCLLNNIRRNKINDVIEHLAEYFNFTKHLDKQTRTYSGGTKRKLNAAMSAMGQSLVCLDEPTAGIDPGATREMWAVLGRIRDMGKSLLLTSHSMEECEALCTRLAIMIKGEFLCMGSLQFLKNKFNKGIIVKIKVGTKDEKSKSKNDSSNYEQLLSKLEKTFKQRFSTVITLERYDYRGMITLRIPDVNLKWSEIFAYVEKIRKPSKILYYTISQTTLEQIFLDFAKEGN